MCCAPHVSGGVLVSHLVPVAGPNSDAPGGPSGSPVLDPGPLASGRPLGHGQAVRSAPTPHSPPAPQLHPSPPPVASLLLTLPDSMASEAGDGGPRPKRRADGREDRPSSKPWHPSPDAEQQDAELRSAMLKGKGAAAEDGHDWRESRPRDRSPDHWHGRDRDRERRPSPRRSRSPARSGHTDQSPTQRYNPPHR